MTRTKDIVDMILKGCTVREIQEEHHLSPYFLRRIIRGKRFQEYVQLQKEITRVFMALGSAEHMYYALTKLADVMAASHPESIRKACTTLLRHGLSEKLLPCPFPGTQAPDAKATRQKDAQTCVNL
jgi:hypothetical protein